MNKLVKTIPKSTLYKEFVSSLNGILNLTAKELHLLTELVRFDMEYVPLPGEAKNVANSENRKSLRKTLGVTPDNLSRYLSKFKKEGILVQGTTEDELTINKAIVPDIIGDRIQLIIILKLKDDTNDTDKQA